MIPTTDNYHHSPVAVEPTHGVMVEARWDGVVWVVAWWPMPLVQVVAPMHLICGVMPPHCSCNRHWVVGGSHCCHHCLHAQIGILSVQHCI